MAELDATPCGDEMKCLSGLERGQGRAELSGCCVDRHEVPRRFRGCEQERDLSLLGKELDLAGESGLDQSAGGEGVRQRRQAGELRLGQLPGQTGQRKRVSRSCGDDLGCYPVLDGRRGERGQKLASGIVSESLDVELRQSFGGPLIGEEVVVDGGMKVW